MATTTVNNCEESFIAAPVEHANAAFVAKIHADGFSSPTTSRSSSSTCAESGWCSFNFNDEAFLNDDDDAAFWMNQAKSLARKPLFAEECACGCGQTWFVPAECDDDVAESAVIKKMQNVKATAVKAATTLVKNITAFAARVKPMLRSKRTKQRQAARLQAEEAWDAVLQSSAAQRSNGEPGVAGLMEILGKIDEEMGEVLMQNIDPWRRARCASSFEGILF